MAAQHPHAAGCSAGTLYYLLAGVAPDPIVFVALQPLNAAFFAVVAGVGLTVFQDTFSAPGLASGLFTNTRRIAAVLSSGMITAVAVLPDSYRAVYLVSAIATMATAGIVVAFLRTPTPGSLAR